MFDRRAKREFGARDRDTAGEDRRLDAGDLADADAADPDVVPNHQLVDRARQPGTRPRRQKQADAISAGRAAGSDTERVEQQNRRDRGRGKHPHRIG
jgi:hypothetical protein